MALSRKLCSLSAQLMSTTKRLPLAKSNLSRTDSCVLRFNKAFATSAVLNGRGSRSSSDVLDDVSPIVEDYADAKARKTTPRLIEKVQDNVGDLDNLVKNATQFGQDKSGDQWTSSLNGQDAGVRDKRDQSTKIPRPKVDPMVTSIVLFPGQGSQFVGMGAKLLDYPNVPELYGVASEILGYDLLKMCLEGPMESLSKTVYSQTSIFVTSVAALEKLKAEHPMAVESCVAAAGFSVGEYAALVFGGCLSFEDGVKLVKARAESMQVASEAARSGMMSVQLEHDSDLGHALDLARKWCQEKKGIRQPVLQVANYLFPEGRVLAGHIEGLDFIEANAQQFKIKPLKRLAVSGAFHTPLMEPAAEVFLPHLMNVKFNSPKIQLLSNVTADAYRGADGIGKLLAKQIGKPVKWEQTMHVMYERKQGTPFPTTYEVGPGRQLGAILKKNNVKAHAQYKAIEV